MIICKACSSPFGAGFQTPQVLTTCTHSFCLKCVEIIRKNGEGCPDCKIPIGKAKPNHEIIQQIHHLIKLDQTEEDRKRATYQEASKSFYCIMNKKSATADHRAEARLSFGLICKYCEKNNEALDLWSAILDDPLVNDSTKLEAQKNIDLI